MESVLKPMDVAIASDVSESYIVLDVLNLNDEIYYSLVKLTNNEEPMNLEGQKVVYAKEVITEEEKLDLQFVQDENIIKSLSEIVDK